MEIPIIAFLRPWRFYYALAVSAAIRVILTKISNCRESLSSGMGGGVK